MLEYEKSRREARRQWEIYNSPEAAEERKRIKREKKAKEHALRQAKTLQKNAERLEMLSALTLLSPKERLSRFALDTKLNLDSITPELIPADENCLTGWNQSEARALITRIGRRKGSWGRLRRFIEHWLTTAEEKAD